MEKILLVINAQKPKMASIDFACRMAGLAKTRLTGLFIENLFYRDVPDSEEERSSYFKTVPQKESVPVLTDTAQAVHMFRDQCQRHGIEADVIIDKGEPIGELIFESRFADLLIVDADIHFYDRDEQLPSHFVKEILAKSECPVLLVPEVFEDIEEIVFCYDGSDSSVFAIKQFTYVLPEFENKKALLLEVNRSGNEEFNEGHRKMMDWLKAHYSSVTYHALKGDAHDELFMYFFTRRKKMIVMGAYGRSLLSNFFRKSSADVLMRMVDLPLFITHH